MIALRSQETINNVVQKYNSEPEFVRYYNSLYILTYKMKLVFHCISY